MCNAKQIRDFDSFIELIDYFDSEEKCIDHLAKLRWDGKPVCPYCASERVNALKGKTKRYKCYGCRKQFGVRVGTIFHDSKLSLRKWFLAIYIFSSHKRGISSHQLAKDLKITQKTAWFVLHRIREIYKDDSNEKLEGVLEIDETFVGGRLKNKHNRTFLRLKQEQKISGTKGKAPVIGILERGGKVLR